MACLALALLPLTSAQAQLLDAQPLPGWYAGPFVGAGFPDSAREAKNGINLQLVAGKVLAEALSVEGQLFMTRFDSELAGGPETEVTGAGLDLALGVPAGGSPLFLVGLGVASQDVGDTSESLEFGNLGLAYVLPFSIKDELWRVEGRYQALFGDDVVEDVRLNVGVLFTFGHEQPPPAPVAEVAADRDGDGVPDSIDKCGDTPRWVRPGADGCPLDGDADGVIDGSDDCPDTPPGAPVDETGCAPKPATAPGPLDEDRDGVDDAVDACPHTVPQYKIDAKGCLIPEDVTLKNVHFDSASWRLTGDGYVLLRSIAASLKAQAAITLEVQGHADASGGKVMNRSLSLQRAEVVRDFLTYLGVEEKRLTVKAYGETLPLTSNETKESRSYNRRVQFRRTDR